MILLVKCGDWWATQGHSRWDFQNTNPIIGSCNRLTYFCTIKEPPRWYMKAGLEDRQARYGDKWTTQGHYR